MLLFSSDTFTVNGITVFPDHEKRGDFWCLPGPVGLETLDGSSEPQFLLTSYAPDVAGSGIQGVGFLNVTLSLKLSDENQQAIIGKIRTVFPDVSDPLLSIVPFDEGTVQIVALDMQGSGGATASPGAAGAGQAVERILGTSAPELFGNNDALFALTLTEEGATILEQAFRDGMAPVGGIYNLKFTGVQPALDVKITADLKRVYDSFSVGLTGQVYFVSAGIDATFEKLRQDQVIRIEVANLTTDASGVDRENWALNLFKDQILAQFFQPSLTPATAQAADAQSVGVPTRAGSGVTTPPANAGGTSHAVGSMGGGSPPAGNNPMSSASNASHAGSGMSSPAGSAGGNPPPAGAAAGGTAGPSAAAGGAPAGTPVGTPPSTPGGSAAPNPIPAAAGSATPAASGGATAAHAAAGATTPAPGASRQTPSAAIPNILAPGTAAAASSAASPFGVALRLKFVQQDELKTVEYEFNQMNAVQRTYAPQGYFGLLLQGVDQSKHFLKIDGNDPFFNHFVVVVHPPHEFAGIGLLQAHVALDYGNAGAKHTDFTFSSPADPAQTWDVFEGLIQQTQFRYTADYQFDPESGWLGEQTQYTLPEVTTENRVLNLDPYAFLGFLQVAVSADRFNTDFVDRVEVLLQYEGPAPNAWHPSNTIIVRGTGAPQFWKLRLADQGPHTYTYSTNCYLKDGTLISTSQTSSTASALIVSDPFNGSIDLTLVPAFSAAKYSQAIVEVSYADPAHKYTFAKTLQVSPGAAPPPAVHIPLIDRTANSFQYQLTFLTTDNQQQRGSLVTATDPVIVLQPS
ncbi:MAG: hypothetical protein JO057_03110 [Chloroflexi bacterium]|nr:hypothetical protein [Chloroflexota bacterium]